MRHLLRPRGTLLHPGEHNCELDTLWTPQGVDEGPACFKVFVFREPDDEDAHFVFELVDSTRYVVNGHSATRVEAMATLDENPHFAVTVDTLGEASEFRVNSASEHA